MKKSKQEHNTPLNNREIMVKRDEKGKLLTGSILNPNGKPRGTKHLSSILQEKISSSTNNGTLTTDGEIILNKVIEMAKSGDIRAIELIWERLEGKSSQPIEHSSTMTYELSNEEKERLMKLLR